MTEALKRDYQLCEEIGSGRFGTVFRCFKQSTGEYFAVKSISKHLLTDSTDRECLENEPKIMFLLSSHPNILRLHDAYEDEHNLHMVMDLCDSNDLYQVISKNSMMSEQSAASIMKSLTQALVHCHGRGICHRDLKPENVLFDTRNRLKLADFGSAEWFGEGRRSMSGVVGTPYYVAPEVLLGREYNEKIDVWSAGVILYIMLAGFPPFYGDSAAEIFEAVMRGNLRFPTRVFRSVSASAKDLLRKMLCRDVSRRFSAEQVLRHPWIVNGGDTSAIND